MTPITETEREKSKALKFLIAKWAQNLDIKQKALLVSAKNPQLIKKNRKDIIK